MAAAAIGDQTLINVIARVGAIVAAAAVARQALISVFAHHAVPTEPQIANANEAAHSVRAVRVFVAVIHVRGALVNVDTQHARPVVSGVAGASKASDRVETRRQMLFPSPHKSSVQPKQRCGKHWMCWHATIASKHWSPTTAAFSSCNHNHRPSLHKSTH
eukprot:775231-Rhodomonas_salina.1